MKRESPVDAIEELYITYYHFLLNFLLKLTHDKQLAEDIIQEVFTRILLRPETVLEIRNIKSFLITSIKNKLIDHYRKKKPSLLKDTHIIENLMIDNYSLNRRMEISDIKQVLLRLPPQYSFVILARDYYGYSYQEIAEILSVSLENVKSRIFRARKLFLKHYKEVSKDD